MIDLSFSWIFGMAFGLLIMDKEDREEHNASWGFVIMLGIFSIQFVEFKIE